MSELCHRCLSLGYCKFEKYVNELAEKQRLNHSNDLKTLLSQAANIHTEISERRIEARNNSCPHINKIDPDYPGKNLL